MLATPLPFIRGRKARTDALPKLPKPEWLKVRAPGSENYHRLKGPMRTLNLHTVGDQQTKCYGHTCTPRCPRAR